MPADNYLVQLERTGVTNHQTFILNLNNALETLDDQFDLCVIDTNPSPDVRLRLRWQTPRTFLPRWN